MRPRNAPRQARPPVPQRGVRARLPPGPLHRQPLARRLRVPAGAAEARRRAAPRRGRRASACPCRGRSAAPSTATSSSGCCARRSTPRRRACPPARTSSWSRARAARELAEREGLEGIRARARRAARRRRSPPHRRDERARPAGRAGPDPRLPAAHLAGAPAPLQVRAHVLAVRRTGHHAVRHTPRRRPGRVAPAALQPLQPRRLRPGRGAAALPPRRSAAPTGRPA